MLNVLCWYGELMVIVLLGSIITETEGEVWIQ